MIALKLNCFSGQWGGSRREKFAVKFNKSFRWETSRYFTIQTRRGNLVSKKTENDNNGDALLLFQLVFLVSCFIFFPPSPFRRIKIKEKEAENTWK